MNLTNVIKLKNTVQTKLNKRDKALSHLRRAIVKAVRNNEAFAVVEDMPGLNRRVIEDLGYLVNKVDDKFVISGW